MITPSVDADAGQKPNTSPPKKDISEGAEDDSSSDDESSADEDSVEQSDKKKQKAKEKVGFRERKVCPNSHT